MQHDLERAIDKARKLLALSTSDNAHEAALAAERAQQILDEYEITHAMLSVGEESPEATESVEGGHEPLDAGRALAAWKRTLALKVCDVNGCRTYINRTWIDWGTKHATLQIIGRPSDVAKSRYMFQTLCREVDHLTRRYSNGRGRTWCNNFRLGVVQTIGEGLQRARQRAADELRRASGQSSTALMRIDQAVEDLNRRSRDAEAWMRANLNLGRGQSSTYRVDADGYSVGRRAGREVQIGEASGALASPAPRLK